MASALGLYILVSIFSSGAESDARWKILILAIGYSIAQGVVLQVVPGLVGLLASVVSSLALIAAGLLFWCGLERKPTLKIVATYLALCAVLSIVSVLIHRASA